MPARSVPFTSGVVGAAGAGRLGDGAVHLGRHLVAVQPAAGHRDRHGAGGLVVPDPGDEGGPDRADRDPLRPLPFPAAGQQVAHLVQRPAGPAGLQHGRHRLGDLGAGPGTEVTDRGAGPAAAVTGDPHPPGHGAARRVPRRHRHVERAAGLPVERLDRRRRRHPQREPPASLRYAIRCVRRCPDNACPTVRFGVKSSGICGYSPTRPSRVRPPYSAVRKCAPHQDSRPLDDRGSGPPRTAPPARSCPTPTPPASPGAHRTRRST